MKIVDSEIGPLYVLDAEDQKSLAKHNRRQFEKMGLLPSAPVDRMSRVELLDRFQAKARCAYTQEQAMSLWLRLRTHLTEKQATAISVGWGHIKDCGESPAEMDAACQQVRSDWGDGGSE